VIINHSLALPLSGSLNLFLNLPTLRTFYPQPAAWCRLVSLGRQPNAGLGWERAAE
jgi:hypothetical protein